jgi:hypothetical protein
MTDDTTEPTLLEDTEPADDAMPANPEVTEVAADDVLVTAGSDTPDAAGVPPAAPDVPRPEPATTFGAVGPAVAPLSAVPPPPPAVSGGSPWARPAEGAAQGWDMSGYAPPPPIRLEEHGGISAIAPATIGSSPLQLAGALALPGAIQAPTSVYVPIKPAAPMATRRGRITLRTSVTILLFVVGVALGGVVVKVMTTSAPPPAVTADSFPSLPKSMTEPVPAGLVAQELVRNDVHGLAQVIDSATLASIQAQLQPLVTFESVTFTGATVLDHDTLASYTVRGRDTDGNLLVVGLVIRLRDGQVVAQ